MAPVRTGDVYRVGMILVTVRLNLLVVVLLLGWRACANLAHSPDPSPTRYLTPALLRLEIGIFVLILVKIAATYAGEIIPCMDAINKYGVEQISMAKRYRRASYKALRSRNALQAGSVATIEVRANNERDAAAIRIQSLVRPVQARKRYKILRKKEILLWHRPEVCELRRKLTIQAYAWLGIYTGTVVWINLCYVLAYDAPTVWAWVTATAVTIVIDVVLRKPIGVLAQAVIQAIRHEVCRPEGLYIRKGRNRRPV